MNKLITAPYFSFFIYPHKNVVYSKRNRRMSTRTKAKPRIVKNSKIFSFERWNTTKTKCSIWHDLDHCNVK